ncbi:adenine-specific DNA methylase [Candidatus Magnetoovum chiemensis]|nr:adenine-specific DNA methylase [Candidatus Magnetoovum chiemensis]
MKRAIEESFPIVEINKLAVPERNAFKPIYQMHKWFARRASCVFRAILLASMKPAGTNIMEEFYKDHTNDSETNGIKILDPFMGGGTTVVEALRLGCRVTGIDLNPVAWFIVKCETEPVDIEQLQDAFKRLENRITSSGKPLKEELLSHYKTECPCCGAGTEDADIIYTFWVKSAVCTNPNCKKEVPLFKDYIISQKSPTIRYVPDYNCSHCKKNIDLDIEPASMIAESNLSINNPKDSSGELRSNKRWALYSEFSASAACPWCSMDNKGLDIKKTLIVKKKKVPLTVLLCPHCCSVWQYRGTLPDDVTCPVCKKDYNPSKGNIPSKGDFLCPSCGTKDKIINSIRKLPQEQLLPVKPYALEGYCPSCAGDEHDIFGGNKKATKITHACNVNKNNGKFFKRITASDLKRYNDAVKSWESDKAALPHPKSKVPLGEKTKSGLIAHHYLYWHQMFNPRQLLCLSTLLKAIGEEDNQALKEMLLSGFFQVLRNQNMFCFYNTGASEIESLSTPDDFHPVNSPIENNVWGNKYGRGTFASVINKIIYGKDFAYKPYDFGQIDKIHGEYRDPLTQNFTLYAQSSTTIEDIEIFDFVITDPPYADNVNYSELSDFFYVWLKLSLDKIYRAFAPEYTPKTEEIIVNPTRGKTSQDFREGLTLVFKNCNHVLKENGIMAFTFHHADGEAWESVLTAICDAGFEVIAVYPIQGDAIKGGGMGAMLISYDLIHVCKKRNGAGDNKQRSWAGVRREIREKAREEIKLIESGRYGVGVRLASMDVNIVLIGKCLELYSKHYGAIVDHNGEIVPLKDALTSIRMMVEQLVTTQNPLPSELEHIDPVSYVYLTCLCDRKEINSDEVHKATRGIIEINELIKAGIIIKGRAKRGRTYEIKLPQERYKELKDLFTKKKTLPEQSFLFPEMEEERFDDIRLADILHYLMGLAYSGENLVPWLNYFSQVIPHIRSAFEYLKGKNPAFQDPIDKALNIIEV